MMTTTTKQRIITFLVIGTIGAILAYIEGMKMPHQNFARNAGSTDDIPLEVAVENQQAAPAVEEDAVETVSTDEEKVVMVEGEEKTSVEIPNRVAQKAATYDRVKEISSPDGFINLPEGEIELALKDLVGKKVILVDFWTYSCINCQRTTPYLNAWYEKYREHGLEIVGLHTPEFRFEQQYSNVIAATEKFNIEYPVVLDNDYSTWFAYKNRYWPRKYLIDIDGFIIYDHIGEGGYAETEHEIQQVLAERVEVLNLQSAVPGGVVSPGGIFSLGSSGPRSPETYFGAERNSFLGNGISHTLGEQSLIKPSLILSNILYLVGSWEFDAEHATNKSAGASIIYRYQAKNVYMVASADTPVRVRVLRDGVSTGFSAGKDVDAEGYVTIGSDQLYELIAEPDGEEHTLELIIEEPGLEAFTFTFG